MGYEIYGHVGIYIAKGMRCGVQYNIGIGDG